MSPVATLHVSGIAKSYGGHELFKDVSFRLTPGQRLALVGRNGAGKTTLLRILAGEISADAGEIARPRCLRLALHDQRPPRASGRTLEAYVAESLADVHAAEARLAELEARMAGGRTTRTRCATTRAPRPRWRRPAATSGARASSRSCAASASRRRPRRGRSTRSPAAS